MSRIEVTTDVAIDAYDVTHSGLTHDQIMEFLLEVDEYVGDLHFTIELRDKLTKIINEETGQ